MNGFLCVMKPPGMTSSDVVVTVRRKTKKKENITTLPLLQDRPLIFARCHVREVFEAAGKILRRIKTQ